MCTCVILCSFNFHSYSKGTKQVVSSYDTTKHYAVGQSPLVRFLTLLNHNVLASLKVSHALVIVILYLSNRAGTEASLTTVLQALLTRRQVYNYYYAEVVKSCTINYPWHKIVPINHATELSNPLLSPEPPPLCSYTPWPPFTKFLTTCIVACLPC